MASESGRGQTVRLRSYGVVDCQSLIRTVSGISGWKAESKEGKSPVHDNRKAAAAPEYLGTREIPWEAGGTTLQA